MYETVLERFPRWVFGEFYRSLKYVRNFPRSTHMFICWRARKRGTGMKAQASCSKSSKDSSSKTNDPVLKKKCCNDFRASEVRCYLQLFQKAFLFKD